MLEQESAITSTLNGWSFADPFSVAAHIQLRKNLAMRKPSDASPNSLSECSICLYPIGVNLHKLKTNPDIAWTSSVRCGVFTYLAFQMHTAYHHRTFSLIHVPKLQAGCRS
jgi:hypothetical protein